MKKLTFPTLAFLLLASACSGTRAPAEEDTGAPDTGDESSVDSGGTDGGGDGSDSAVDTGSDGTKPCDATKAPGDDPCVLKDDLGVFVSSKSGNDEFPGTKVKPLKTITKALAAAKARGLRVYACAEEFAESVALVDGVDLFGGVDCVGGAVGVAGQTTLKPATGPALLVEGTTKGVRVESVLAQAPNGSASDVNSIAMVARNAKGVVLRNVSLVGGDAAKGADGSYGTIGTKGAAGTDGGKSIPCLPHPVAGKGGGTSPNLGGDGGDAGCGPFKGGDREPSGGKNAANTTGSFGIGGTPALSSLVSCKEGLSGKPGTDGGAGAGGAEIGTFTTIYVPSDGKNGSNGTDGTAGGGGGAGYYSTLVVADPGSIYSGGAGGGGGSGGGGGGGSVGGKGGGGSFALLSIDSDITLDKCSLTSGRGGKGGAGFNQTAGGLSGKSGGGGVSSGRSSEGINDQPGCAGGTGGTGGNGGASGGGGGGPSVPIVFKGTAPKRTAGDTKVGSGGEAGGSGLGAPAAKPGLAAETYEVK